MDIRQIANNVSSTINDNFMVTLTKSTGYTIGPGRMQVPNYEPPITGPAQMQALDGVDLKQLDGLNIQGEIKAIYLRGIFAGVVRPDQVGGDIITIAAPAPAHYLGTWLIIKVLEGWSTWTKAAIVKQVA